MATTATNGYLKDRRIDSQLRKFGRIFGVSSEYTRSGSILPLHDPTDSDLDRILGDQGVILDPAHVVGFYFDWDRVDPPNYELRDDLSEPAVQAYPHGHKEVPAVTFKTATGNSTTLSRDYVDRAGRFYNVDLLEHPENVLMHSESRGFPIKLNDPEEDWFLMVAPRIINGADEWQK